MKRKEENKLISNWNEHNDKYVSEQLSYHIFSSLKPTILRIASKLGLQDFYQDAISEAFLVLRDNVLSGRYDPNKRASVSTYCMRIAINKLKTERKRRIKQELVNGEYTSRLDKEDTREPKEILIKSYDKKLLFKAISELNEPIKKVFCLRTGIWPEDDKLVYGKKMTNEEIGAIFCRSHGWAAKQYLAAKETLYQKLTGVIE
jgi:RNA polymerase sigma factor (sigma-70 family)